MCVSIMLFNDLNYFYFKTLFALKASKNPIPDPSLGLSLSKNCFLFEYEKSKFHKEIS